MLFNSLHFLVFFPIVVLVYFIVPAKVRYLWLLVTSYYFYMSWNPAYLLLIVASTAITYICGLLIEKYRERPQICHLVMTISLVLNLSILGFYKYFFFLLENINKVFSKLHMAPVAVSFDILLPVGISFYIFQALGYTIDVYRGTIEAEKNPLRYALFVSFFPQLVAGPIERSGNLLKQLRAIDQGRCFNFKSLQTGLLIMLFGYFQKMVIADRVAIFVNTIFDNYTSFQGLTLLLAAIGFTLQIYCDFAGYTNIAIGAAKVMGFDLMNNFNCPYFALSIKDFWSRWHISLTTWFRDYLYFPLGGSRKRTLRKYMNIMIVFLLSGLWHGASWHYLFWGGLHGFFRVIGEWTTSLRKKLYHFLHINQETSAFHLGQMFVTFSLVVFAWIFFRAQHVSDAMDIIRRIFSQFDPWIFTDGSLYQWGLDQKDIHVLECAVVILTIIDLFHYKKFQLTEWFATQNILFRVLVIYVVFFAIVLFGIYGPEYNASQFVYFQF